MQPFTRPRLLVFILNQSQYNGGLQDKVYVTESCLISRHWSVSDFIARRAPHNPIPALDGAGTGPIAGYIQAVFEIGLRVVYRSKHDV